LKPALVVLGILILALVEGGATYMYRNKQWKELALYGFLLAAGLVLIVMDIMYANPFRVTKVVDILFRPYFAAVKSLLLRI